MRIFPFALLAGLAFCPLAQAEQIKIFLNSGTGFFVSEDGYIISNLHVVKNCRRITIAGTMPEREVTISGQDADHDLVLLKSNAPVSEFARFRYSNVPLDISDRVLIIGYPGEAFKSGAPVTREAQVVSRTGPQGEAKWLQLSDVVSEGNSGGPLLDTSGNVAGVVSAKAVIYTYRESEPEDGTTTRSGIALNLPVVEEFLKDNGVRYRSGDSGIYLSADRIGDQARNYIVNVRCEYKREVEK